MKESMAGRGLEILGFPCNQFGAQEPHDDATVKQFAKDKGANWPMFSKIEVNGDNAHPLYKQLRALAMEDKDISWNFGKFLVENKTGTVKYYLPDVQPETMIADVEESLNW